MNLQFIETNKISKKYVKDFVNLHRRVFNVDFSQNDFEEKYLKNTFGISLIVFAYEKNNIIGAKGFLNLTAKNSKFPIFQSCDSMVDFKYRSMGLFQNMTVGGIEKLTHSNSQSIVFSFSNQNSRFIYKKMKWNYLGFYDLKLYYFLNFNQLNKVPIIESNYFDLIYKRKRYVKLNSKFYLVKQKGLFFSLILCEIEENEIRKRGLKKDNIFRILFFKVFKIDNRFTKNFKKKTILLANSKSSIDVPYYYGDFYLG